MPMPDPSAIVKETTEKLKGKKAKLKKISAKPEGTKSQPLPGPLKKALAEALDADLGKVRVHTGGNTADLAKEVGAKAFAIGPDIYFAKASDAKDMKVLAHELTHVVQQGRGKMPPETSGKAFTSK